MSYILVGAFPGLFGAAETVIAVDAHALCIVRLVRVRATRDRALLVDLLRVIKALYIIAILVRAFRFVLLVLVILVRVRLFLRFSCLTDAVLLFKSEGSILI